MSESGKETLCMDCAHLGVCSIKNDYLRILESLPKCDDNFSLQLSCKHFMKYIYQRDNLIDYITSTGNPCGSKIDI